MHKYLEYIRNFVLDNKISVKKIYKTYIYVLYIRPLIKHKYSSTVIPFIFNTSKNLKVLIRIQFMAMKMNH